MYWGSNGRFQEWADALQKKIPFEGEIVDKDKNPKLEKFRQAVNCYYDLYNNGLCNRAEEFYHIFGFPGVYHGHRVVDTLEGHEKRLQDIFEARVELVMDNLILLAAHEQGIC